MHFAQRQVYRLYMSTTTVSHCGFFSPAHTIGSARHGTVNRVCFNSLCLTCQMSNTEMNIFKICELFL